MINLIQNKDLLANMQRYMFTNSNMVKGYNSHLLANACASANASANANANADANASVNERSPSISKPTKKDSNSFTPFHKDKLFWCFFIIIKGHEEYEINRTNAFSIEKKFKIEAVEKLKSIKDKLKELKLKRTELENELVNEATISLKGLYALCLIYNVSITYVYGRKYYEINPQTDASTKKNIIIQNDKKEDSLRWNDNDDEFYKKIQEEYWFIDNIQKPLKAPSAYSLKDLQDICNKLHIETHVMVNDKQKQKTKTKLYEEILQNI